MSKETILVVDDEKNIVELVCLYLEKEDFSVESAADGEDVGIRLNPESGYAVRGDLLLSQHKLPDWAKRAQLKLLRSTGQADVA